MTLKSRGTDYETFTFFLKNHLIILVVFATVGIVAIENLQPGDIMHGMKAVGEEQIVDLSQELDRNVILETYAHEVDETYIVTIDGESIEATAEHPFYNSDGEEVQAKDLKEGDELAIADGDTATVDSVECIHHDEPVMVYNIAVCDSHTYFVGENHVLVHNMCRVSPEDNGEKPDVLTGEGYGASDPPVRVDGEWSLNDLRQALLGHPPRGLGSPDIHHGDQMPGGALHEVLAENHRNNPLLHPNLFNQGVTNEMRVSDRQLHWWYRAREQGADQLLPDWIYDD